MSLDIFDGKDGRETMNEELSDILEKALMYATPLPLSPPEENMANKPPEVTVYSDLHGSNFNLEELYDESVDCFVQNVENAALSNDQTNTLQTAFSSYTPNISEMESSEQIFLDNFIDNHDSVGNSVQKVEYPHQNNESLDNISNKVFQNCDGKLSDEEIQVLQSSMVSNFDILESDSSLMEIHPDSTSDTIHDLNDIADACLQFENDSKLKADSTSTVGIEINGVKPKVKRRRRREKNPDPPPPPVLPPCDICNDKSSGYHYGANTCEACKGFYRRTLKKKEVDYKCRCTPEEKESWKQGPFKNGCPACRYEKCLAVGMSKNAIKIGRYTLNHKTQNIKKIKSIESIDSLITSLTEMSSDTSIVSVPDSDDVSTSPSTSLAVSDHSNVSPCTSDDSCRPKTTVNLCTITTNKEPAVSLKEIDYIVKTLTEAHTTLIVDDRLKMSSETIKRNQAEYLEKYQLRRELFGALKNISHEEFKAFYKSTGIDIDGRLERLCTGLKYFEEKVALVVAFAKEIPGFKHLSLDDQANLIKASRVETSLLCGYKSTLQNMDRERKMLTLPWGVPLHIDELGKIFPMEHLSLRYKYAKQLAELNLSEQEESLLRAIFILFTDRCKLDNPVMVDTMQEKMVMCLQHLISLRPNGSSTLLYKIFNIITSIRELTDKEMEFAKNLLVEWPMLNINKYHLVREFLC